MTPDYPAYVPVINDEIDSDATAEEEALLAAVEDDTLLPAQEEALRRGAVLAAKSDRSATGGAPLGVDLDDISGTRVGVVSAAESDGGLQLTQVVSPVELTQRNDPDLRAVFNKHFSTPTQGSTDMARRLTAAFKELDQIKKARRHTPSAHKPVNGANPVTPDFRNPNLDQALHGQSNQFAAARQRPAPVDVTFDYGTGDVTYARYSAAFIHGFVLVLVVSEDDRWRGVTLPRVDVPLLVTLPGLDAPVPAQYAGVSFPHKGDTLCVLFVSRDSE